MTQTQPAEPLVFFVSALPSNSIPLQAMPCILSYIIFDRSIICKIVSYIDQSDNSSCHVLGFDTSVSDWSDGNMNSDVISNGMLLHVSALPTKRKEKGTILIRLCYMID
jgi:hypothetical protein